MIELTAAAPSIAAPGSASLHGIRRIFGAAGRDRWNALAVLAVLVVTAVAHGFHMLDFPYIEADEGTYISQAWALIHEGRLAPYTYFYDHAPGGWIQIAGWDLLTGGTNGAFGDPVASGRAFMLALQLVSTTLVVLIGRRLGGSPWAGVAAGLLFGLSPYGLPYQRRVLLDNIATVWMLASFWLLLAPKLHLSRVWLSAVALAIAVWSKEIAVVLLPAFAVLAVQRAPRASRLFAAIGWPVIFLGIVSAYPLMAILKGELFPTGSLLGGTNPHVSLVCSLVWQSGRGTDGGLLNPASAFWATASHWAAQDPVLVLGGTLAAVVAPVLFRREPGLAALGWSCIVFWLFLGRSGVVLDFYLVPLLPFLALCLTCTAWRTWSRSRRFGHGVARRGATALSVALVCVAVGVTGVRLSEAGTTALWRSNPVEGQKEAVAWLERHVPSSSRIVIDMSMWTGLHDPAGERTSSFRSAEYYWKVGDDPETRRAVFSDDWRTVNYIVADPQLLSDTRSQRFSLIQSALNHSTSIAHFDTGWGIDIRKVDPRITTHTYSWAGVKSPASQPACMTGG